MIVQYFKYQCPLYSKLHFFLAIYTINNFYEYFKRFLLKNCTTFTKNGIP